MIPVRTRGCFVAIRVGTPGAPSKRGDVACVGVADMENCLRSAKWLSTAELMKLQHRGIPNTISSKAVRPGSLESLAAVTSQIVLVHLGKFREKAFLVFSPKDN